MMAINCPLEMIDNSSSNPPEHAQVAVNYKGILVLGTVEYKKWITIKNKETYIKCIQSDVFGIIQLNRCKAIMWINTL